MSTETCINSEECLENKMSASFKTMAWFRGFADICTVDSRSLLLFGPSGGLRYAAMDGRIVEGSQVLSANTLGRAFKRGRFLRRAQRRFLRRKRRRRLTAMLLCLPRRLGQNTWLRVRQFTQRAATSFLQQVGQKQLPPLVSVVSHFVENTRMEHHRVRIARWGQRDFVYSYNPRLAIWCVLEGNTLM